MEGCSTYLKFYNKIRATPSGEYLVGQLVDWHFFCGGKREYIFVRKVIIKF